MTEVPKNRSQLGYEPDYLTEPGTILQETLDTLGRTVDEFAIMTGFTKHFCLQLIQGTVRITPDVARCLEKSTPVPARFWNNLESQYQQRKKHLSSSETGATSLQ